MALPLLCHGIALLLPCLNLYAIVRPLFGRTVAFCIAVSVMLINKPNQPLVCVSTSHRLMLMTAAMASANLAYARV